MMTNNIHTCIKQLTKDEYGGLRVEYQILLMFYNDYIFNPVQSDKLDTCQYIDCDN